MPSKLKLQERLKLIERVVLGKEPVSKVCQEAGISRTLFYRWLKKYKEAPTKPEALAPGKQKPPVSPRKVTPELEQQILSIVRQNPSWSSKKISVALPRDALGKPIVGNHGVQNVLQRLNLSTEKARIAHVRAISRPKEEVITGVQLSPEQKLEMLERVVLGKEKVSKVCQEYGISRTLFYRLKRRYKEAALEEKLWAISPQVRHIERYWRQTPQRYEQAVLDLVGKHPEYSVRKLVEYLPEVAGVPIVGHHGVQNILRRHSLSLYEQRLAYASAQVTPVTRLVGAFEQAFARLFVFPVEVRAAVVRFLGIAAASTFLTVVVLGSLGYFATVFRGVAPIYRPGLIFASIALSVGSLFFFYSMKYYFTLAVVLSFSRQPGEPAVLGLMGETRKNGPSASSGWLARIFGLGNGPSAGSGLNGKERRVVGLEPNLESVKLERHPFISVHLPFYNEKNVADRILSACTSMDYENYEVIVIDDSTDETVEILEKWKSHPRVKIIHRQNREGFKGGALRLALSVCDPRTEFVVVFDADFIPYSDTLELFLKYFKTYNNDSEDFSKSNIAAVQGYQWHVLNKSENWITRGVRTEYSGSYVIERSGTEVLGALKQIAGSVYCIRADILKKFGWGTSITEDFELTLRLYEQGYKVVYTPYVQGPAECVSTIKRLIRQRMRWAEGHSHNIRKMFLKLLRSPRMTLIEKLEFLYLSPYYLQAFFFLIGTFSWLMAETVFRARLPFWTSLWGWSLVLTNFFSLPLMNAVGLFLEEGEHRDYLGILSFIALSYLLVPFQAYASIKGFLEKQEGPWFRTPKTGLITDIFTRGRFYRWVSGIIPGRQPAVAAQRLATSELASSWKTKLTARRYTLNPYVALATANNQFSNFKIRPRHIRWLGKAMMVFLIISSLLISQLAWKVPLAQATAGTQIKTVEYFLYQYNSATQIVAGNGVDNTAYGATCGSADSDPSVSITIPESGVIVKRAIVEWRTIVTGAAVTPNDFDIQFCNSSTTASDTGTGNIFVGTAEQYPLVVRLEASSTILTGTNTYWFDARLAVDTRNTNSLKIYITYEYDQTSTTQLKTVRFYGTQQTGVASTTDLDSVINPNLTEGSITVRDSFAELWGQVNLVTDNNISASYAASGTCGADSTVAVTEGASTTAYSYLVLFDMSNTINLTTDNCIRHGVSVATFARSTEWVITFEYSYYSTAESDDLLHTKTVRYMMGTRQAALPITLADIGSHAINLPENKPSNPFTRAYTRFISSIDAAENLDMCISTATGCTGTTETQAAIDYGDGAEQGGGIYALDDVTSFFNTNWSNGTTFYVSGSATAATNIMGTSAEIVITFKFNADTSSTIIKTVYFWVGQETIGRTAAFNQASEAGQANFDTFWPETGTKTFRNGAVYSEFTHSSVSTTTITDTITIDDLGPAGTDAAIVDVLGTGENLGREHMVKISSQVPSPFGAQADINFSLTVSASTVIRSPIAYFTVETATSLAPEFAFIFIPLAIILPLGMRIYLDNKKRGLNNG